MIRFSLFLAFFSLVFTISAQEVESVFLNKNSMEWYDKEIKTLDKSIAEINSGESYAAARNQLKKSLRIINTNCLAIYHQMENAIDPARLASLKERKILEPGYTNVLDLRNIKMKEQNSKEFFELRMTQTDVNAFLDNLSKFKNIDDELKHAEYNFKQETDKSMTNQLTKLSSLAHKNNQLLKSKYN